MTLLQALHETLHRLLALPKLLPEEVAGILSRRVELLSESGPVTRLDLVGGPAIPFGVVRLTVNKATGRSMLEAEVVPGEDLPIRITSEPWRSLPNTFKPPDPSDSKMIGAAIYRVPQGELRFGVQAPKYHVRLVVLVDLPLLDWSTWKPV